MPDAASPIDIRALADELLHAAEQRRTLPSLMDRHPALSIDDAYAIAETIAALRRQRGERTVGRKIGLTNPAGWSALGADAPLWGYVYDSSLLMAADGHATVDLSLALAPRIEPEIGFCLGRAIDPRDTSIETLLRCIDWVAPCFEIIDSHFAGWSFKAREAVADFGVHYKLVVGEPYPVAGAPNGMNGLAASLADALGSCEVTLLHAGVATERGRGANTLGHPLRALAALVKLLAAQPGASPLQPGDIITTGTLTTARDIAAGQHWGLEFAGLPLAPLQLTLVTTAGTE